MQNDEFVDLSLHLGTLFCSVVQDVSVNTMQHVLDAGEAAALLSDTTSSAPGNLPTTSTNAGSQEVSALGGTGSSRCMSALADFIAQQAHGQRAGASEAQFPGAPSGHLLRSDPIRLEHCATQCMAVPLACALHQHLLCDSDLWKACAGIAVSVVQRLFLPQPLMQRWVPADTPANKIASMGVPSHAVTGSLSLLHQPPTTRAAAARALQDSTGAPAAATARMDGPVMNSRPSAAVPARRRLIAEDLEVRVLRESEHFWGVVAQPDLVEGVSDPMLQCCRCSSCVSD